MADPSIEFLGQKFSFPTTWQGASSVLVICITVGFISWTLEPEQINSYGTLFGAEADNELISLNKKLNNQVVELNAELERLAKLANLDDAEKEAVKTKISSANEEINEAYAELIAKQKDKKMQIDAALINVDEKYRIALNQEQSRVMKQIDQFQTQQLQIQF